MTERFYITDDGIRLSAVLDRPGEGRRPLVIIIHGFTGNKEERHIVAVSRMLNALGFATLRADMYGHGSSDGQFRNHTLYKWLTNALSLVDYARGREDVGEIFLCGHSQGGLTAMLAAAMERDRIAGLIPLSPAAMIPEYARSGELLGLCFDPEHIPETLSAFDGQTLGGNYIRVAQTIDVEAAIDRYDGPVLLVHGDEDESVPVEVSIEAANRYRHCQLALIPGDDHCYDHHLDLVLGAVRTWMAEHSNPAFEQTEQ